MNSAKKYAIAGISVLAAAGAALWVVPAVGVEWRVYISLFIFGVLYAALVYWMNQNEMSEGFTSLLVVAGTTVTLIGAGVIEHISGDVKVLQVFFCFAASGFPMVIGDIGAFVVRRQNGRAAYRQLLGVEGTKKDDDSETMAR